MAVLHDRIESDSRAFGNPTPLYPLMGPDPRANSRLHSLLGTGGIELVRHVAGSIQRILPHVEISSWWEDTWRAPGAIWHGSARRGIVFTIAIGQEGNPKSRSLNAFVTRRRVSIDGAARGTLDTREHAICAAIGARVSEELKHIPIQIGAATLHAIRDSFDESVIAQHIEHHHSLQMSVSSVFAELHTM